MGSSAGLYKATWRFTRWTCGFSVAGRKTSQVDLRFGCQCLVLTHHFAQEFGTDGVYRRLVIMSVHQAGELFQLLEVHKELDEYFVKPGVLLHLFRGTHIALPFEDTGAVYYNPRRVVVDSTSIFKCSLF